MSKPGHFGSNEPIRSEPSRVRYPCRAHQCRMPGTIFLAGPESGICAWHFGAEDLPAVTRVLLDWECVTDAINRGRAFTNDPERAFNVKAQREMLEGLWLIVAGATQGSGWKNRLAPASGEVLGDWVRRLEGFLRNRIKETTQGTVLADDTAPTSTVADMLTRQRGALAAPRVDEWAGA